MRDFLRTGEDDEITRGGVAATSGVFDGAAPPPGYSLANFLALVDRYGEMLRGNELERSGALVPANAPGGSHESGLYGALYGQPFDQPPKVEPLWLGASDSDALVAVADLLANCARPSAAHVERLCDACGGRSDAHSNAARVAGSLLRLYARDCDAVPPDLKASLLRCVGALCSSAATAKTVALFLQDAGVVKSSANSTTKGGGAVVFAAPPTELKLPKAMVPGATVASDQQTCCFNPAATAAALNQPGAVNPLVQQLDECCGEGEGVADRDLRGVETRLRTYGATAGVLARAGKG